VAPNGTVKSVKPAQKANARLEEAAMRELRRWRFEPLSRTLPQREQKCVVTFNFKLN
jgi:TonB family protein